jgi:hypothetical protein
LASLIDQELKEIEIVVTDNSDDPECRQKIEELCKVDPRIRYEWTHDRAFDPRVGIPSLYDAAEIGVKMTTAPYLVFPNCDSYYTPHFAQHALVLAESGSFELLICNFVQGRPDMPYFFFDAHPEACRCDKTAYLIKREWFPEEWPGKVTQYGVADGILVNELVAKGIRVGKFTEVHVVHN